MITGIILASGFSKRMGRDKLLLKINRENIVEKVIKACTMSKLENIILVYRKDEVGEIGSRYGIKTIYNENAYLGQSEAMKLGIKGSGNPDAYMFLVGDQPFLTWDLIDKLIEEYKNTKLPIVVPYYNGNRGMPMIISSAYKDQLLKVKGDKGGRDIVNNNISEVKQIHIKNIKAGMDIDTPEDLSSTKNLS